MSDAFGVIFNGYDRGAVDNRLKDLRSQISAIEAWNRSLHDEVESVENALHAEKAKNAELEAMVERLPERVSFSALGPQFEEVLRLAEDKSTRLVEDARSEASKIRSSAQAKSAEVLRDAEERASNLLSQAETRSAELRLNAETAAAGLVTQANIRLAQATEKLAQARREASEISANAEREIEASRVALQRDIENEDLVLSELRAGAAREQLAFEQALTERRERFEASAQRRQRDAEDLVAKLLEDAERQANDILESARMVTEESEALSVSSQFRADEILSEARRVASNILDMAQAKTAEISERTQHHVEGLRDRSQARSDLAREERAAIEAFIADIADTRAVDSLISRFEQEFIVDDEPGFDNR
ncbi:MAG TPA: hypothetical protein VK139_04485 [Microbacteriaceae bacterium]|nr:hypothetical protein [Microbacteriaceae bacterium]